MYLLKKAFQLRDKANPDMEKPFLEHLEDLRSTITRVIVTLLVATVVCFVFRNDLMTILRKPVEEVWLINQAAHLPAASDIPRAVDVETWEQAKRMADAVAPLAAAEREAFFGQLGDEALRFHVESVFLYRAALELPKDKRAAYLGSLTGTPPELRKQVAGLLEKEPSARLQERDDLRLMGAFNPTEAFMLSMKLAFFAGIVVSFPLLLYFILQFVLPGLHQHEKKALFPAMLIGFGLFITGVLFAYFQVLPRVLEFFFTYSKEMGIANEWRIGYYISFATQFTLIFGLAFELPVVVMTMVKIGLLGHETMRKTRAYAILAIFVIAAVITPTPDAFTLCLLAIPMVLLYEICIWLAWWIHRKEVQREAQEEKERMARLLAAPPPERAAGEPPAEDAPAPDDEAGETEDRGDWVEEGQPVPDDPPLAAGEHAEARPAAGAAADGIPEATTGEEARAGEPDQPPSPPDQHPRD